MKIQSKAIMRLFPKYFTLILFMILLGIHFCNQISIYAGKQQQLENIQEKENGVGVEKNANNTQQKPQIINNLSLKNLKNPKNFEQLFPLEKRTINDFSYYKQNNQLTKEDIIIALNDILKEINKESNIQIQSDDFEIASEQLEEKYESEEMQWQGSFQIEDILGNKIEFNFTKKTINLEEIITNAHLGTIQITPNITDEQRKQLICEAIWQKNPQLQNKFLPKDFQFSKNKDGSNNFCKIEYDLAKEDQYHEYESEMELEINYQQETNAASTTKTTTTNSIIFYTIIIIITGLIVAFLLILIYKIKHQK
ncbi:hypothetical protein [Rice orange leaf phytoplasma]|uniref:hypothetical protein n=1 Tax=Rice orange leaf phytoplasma TaxID=146897 RepID=UPI0008F5658B|nr:hypothetical protein [Rice orange leaf phytoplasma]OIJ45078.1 hypothetical protein BHE82_00790 [Rice orange leaf phytoplasma]